MSALHAQLPFLRFVCEATKWHKENKNGATLTCRKREDKTWMPGRASFAPNQFPRRHGGLQALALDFGPTKCHMKAEAARASLEVDQLGFHWPTKLSVSPPQTCSLCP